MNTLKYVTALSLAGEKDQLDPSMVKSTQQNPSYPLKINFDKTSNKSSLSCIGCCQWEFPEPKSQVIRTKNNHPGSSAAI